MLASWPFLSLLTLSSSLHRTRQPAINRRRPAYLQQQIPYPGYGGGYDDEEVDPELLEALGEGNGGSLPVHERLNRYHGARELRLQMLRAQRDYEELLGLDFQPHLVSSPRVRERAAARQQQQQQRARSLSPGRTAGMGMGSGGGSGSPARARALAASATHGALPTVANLSVFDRLALEGRDRMVRRREGRGADDPECTFRPHLYTGAGAVRSPSAASSARSATIIDDDLGSVGSSSVGCVAWSIGWLVGN